MSMKTEAMSKTKIKTFIFVGSSQEKCRLIGSDVFKIKNHLLCVTKSRQRDFPARQTATLFSHIDEKVTHRDD